ncbi:MAG TPA: hypothetical protein VEH04_02965 [Verrucomicrobiae bacterium]|nr:hypothetical protein [Verrucomicrobiae bacterium]
MKGALTPLQVHLHVAAILLGFLVCCDGGPANDLFVNASVLLGLPCEAEADDRLATVEPEEGGEDWFERTLWWRWTAPSNVAVRASLTGSDSGHYGELFTGTSITNLLPVATIAFGDATFEAEAGVTYFLRSVAGFNQQPRVRIALHPEPVRNDAFAERLQIPTGVTNLPGSTIGASTTDAESLRFPETFGGTVWYAGTSPISGTMAVFVTNHVNGTYPELRVALYSGSRWRDLKLLGTGLFSAMGRLKAGMPYVIAIGGESADFGLSLHYPSRPSNDDFIDRMSLEGSVQVVSGENYSATAQRNEPELRKGSAGASVWYEWTAPADGSVTLTVEGREFRPLVGVYRGNALRELRKATDSIEPANSSVWQTCYFKAKANTKYVFSVDGFSRGMAGAFQLSLRLTTLKIVSPAPNSVISAATPPMFAVNVPDPEWDGVPSVVEYYLQSASGNWVSLGRSWSQPFSLTPTNLPPGRYLLFARGSSSFGSFVSPPVPVVIRPFSDDFKHSIPLSGYFWTFWGSTASATRERNEPEHGNDSVWWHWTAPSDGTVKLGMTPELRAAGRFKAYSGNRLHNLKPVQIVNDRNMQPTLRVSAGKQYRFVVTADRRSRDEGADEFGIWGEMLTVQINTPGRVFRQPVDIPITLTTTEDLGTIQRVDYFAEDSTNVFIGSVTQPPFAIVWSNAFSGYPSIHARVVKHDGSEAPGGSRSIVVRPLNDDFTNAVALGSGTNLLISARVAGATKEQGEPAHGSEQGVGSVWWLWTAPANGRLRVTRETMDFRESIGLFTGTSVSHLTNAAPDYPFTYIEADVEAGRTYVLVAWNVQDSAAEIQLRFHTPPLNDHFENRLNVSGEAGVFEGHTVGATVQDGEPGWSGYSHTVWWKWSAPRTGLLFFQDLQPLQTLTLYRGQNLTNLSYIGEGSSPLEVAAGTEYAIALSTSSELDFVGGRLQFVPGETNDAYAGRITLAGTNVVFSGSNSGATMEPGEPASRYDVGRTLWWRWTAPGNGSLYLRLSPWWQRSVGEFDVYEEGQLSNLVAVVPARTDLPLRVHGGSSYSIRWDGQRIFDQAATLELQWVPSPPNDDFANAIEVNGIVTVTNGSFRGAGLEPLDFHRFYSAANSVWYTWRAPQSGEFKAILKDADQGARIRILRGATLSSLQEIGTAVDPNESRFDAVSGLTYHVAIAGVPVWEPDMPEYGTFVLEIRHADEGQASGVQPAWLRPRGFDLDGCFQIEAHWPPGASYEVEKSDDLIEWQPLETVVSPGLPELITDCSAGENETRYYRFRQR